VCTCVCVCVSVCVCVCAVQCGAFSVGVQNREEYQGVCCVVKGVAGKWCLYAVLCMLECRSGRELQAYVVLCKKVPECVCACSALFVAGVYQAGKRKC
jgi:hypothetical protein